MKNVFLRGFTPFKVFKIRVGAIRLSRTITNGAGATLHYSRDGRATKYEIIKK